jgi:uncharacterized protein YqfB (UPF0267 family)
MKGIMFIEKYGLESAVLNGNKTRTWREDKKPRYEVGEIVAIKQCYKYVCDYFCEQNNRKYIDYIALYSHQKGWLNKMFVKNELMPHQIRITSVKKCRLKDLTDEDCLREGIKKINTNKEQYTYRNACNIYPTANNAFKMLIGAINGKNYWDSNPEGYAYEFELVK